MDVVATAQICCSTLTLAPAILAIRSLHTTPWPLSYVYCKRGKCWLAKYHINEAISDFDEAIRLDPKCMLAYKDKIGQVLTTLNSREREVIKLRYGLADGFAYTHEEIGRIFKVTPERARQIEAKALQMLRRLDRQDPTKE